MTSYRVDRAALEAHSTKEILRILREERDEYTPEALRIFEEILAERGVTRESAAAASGRDRPPAPADDTGAHQEVMVRDPRDAVMVLNRLLGGVLDGSIDPDVAQVATNLVLAILKALEQD
ncbi:MAG: hypothetical protein FJY85_11805 [Deltaproteobacteria bacterium]|nr:hypothetical protein [Deltaproteobacteria bacterium]